MSIRDDNDSHLEVSEEGEVAEMTLVEHLVSKIWKSWDRKREKKLPIDFPSIWVNFSCILKVASFGIRWRSPTRCFNIAYANIYILNQHKQINFNGKWVQKRIEIFKTLAKPAEIKRLNKAIKLIPKDGVFHISKSIEARTPHSATSPAVDLVAFREQDESHHEQKQELKRKYDVIEETNNEDDADYDSEDDVSEDENDDYDDADHNENYYDNNYDNDEPLDD
ncbi:unnamed protein product [Rotaria socialis]|uniref:Uncharacterized protein n=2 Tax=Rotaria socialis TaxID=392032 RepID=A0A818L6R6_9BILA|nr:unnamed protein product [Rotaria socialis]CAF3572120.1 unnamed protein product [Rotaria socialis]CAF3610999.1 unnamed protein product [Rotaria socialis]CAF3668849.1 unnamed protein product [Rotaria socialis]CAF4506195.1 unnamed protein product [Rotaria socialis]